MARNTNNDMFEPLLTLGSAAVAEPLAGLYGLLGGGAEGVRKAREALTYMPRTPTGRKMLQSLGEGVEAVSSQPQIKGLLDSYESLADRAGAVSPALGAAVKTLPTAAMTFGPGGAINRAAVSNVAAGAGRGVTRAAMAAERALDAPVTNALNKGGLLGEMVQAMGHNTRSNVYLPHKPSKPNPLVGTRFEREFVGDLAPKAPVRIEDLKGSSLLAMPWDSTSRGYSIKSISDEVLPHPVLTTGGQDFARDWAHINANVGGASNLDIAKRIQDRVRVAARENSHFGGNGSVYSLPMTMGAEAENFSTMPTELLLNLIQNRELQPDKIKQINEWVRASPIVKKKKLVRPFENFAGVDTDEGLAQFLTGEGIDTTAGELRKAFAREMQKVRGQQLLGYNLDDMVNALTDPALQGVPKGYAGNTIIKSDPLGQLSVSDHPSYDTNFPGRYFGSFLHNMPIEKLMPKTYKSLEQEFAGKTGDMRTNVIGAMEKRKGGISEIVDQQVIDSVNNYLTQLNRP